MTTEGCEPVEARRESFSTFGRWWEGAALSYLRRRFVPVDGAPAAYERWFDEAPRVIVVPAELGRSSFEATRVEGLSEAIGRLESPGARERVTNAVGDPEALADLADEFGVVAADLPWLTALTAMAAASAAQAQAKPCEAECPYCHGLTCLFSGECIRTTPHGGSHKCNINHTWR